jgi:hypothetical protein
MAADRRKRFIRVLCFAVAVLGMHSVDVFAQDSQGTNLDEALTKLDRNVQDAMAKTKVREFLSRLSTGIRSYS